MPTTCVINAPLVSSIHDNHIHVLNLLSLFELQSDEIYDCELPGNRGHASASSNFAHVPSTNQEGN